MHEVLNDFYKDILSLTKPQNETNTKVQENIREDFPLLPDVSSS